MRPTRDEVYSYARHTLAAVSLLPGYAARGLSVTLIGGGQRVCALRDGMSRAFSPARQGYLSLFAIGQEARGVCAENLKYPLADASLPPHTTLGVSNEFIVGRAARVSVASGCLLLVWQQPWDGKEE